MTKNKSAPYGMRTPAGVVSLLLLASIVPASAQAAIDEGAVEKTKVLAPIRTIESFGTSQPNYATTPLSTNAEDYFEFVDALPASSALNELRPWTVAEKNAVRPVVQKIFEQLPGLVVHAAGGRKIALLKSGLPHEAQAKTSAVSVPEGFLFSDGFFIDDKDYQRHVLVHELVHGSDFGGQIAFSKEWVGFANPVITELRDTCKLHHPGEFSDDLVKGKWVSFYGTANLSEALAEYFRFANLDARRFRVDPAFATFAEKLKSPSKEELEFQDHLKNAFVYFRAGKHEDAIVEMEKSLKLKPDASWVMVHIAASYSLKPDYPKALAISRKALKLLQEAGVPDTEPGALYLDRTKSYALTKLGRNKEALAILQKLTILEPGSTYALLASASCNAKLGRLSEAATNYYVHHANKQKPCDYRILSLDPSVVLAALDQQVYGDPSNPNLYETRANYKEHLGDLEKDRAVKVQHYESALGDMNKAKSCPGADVTHIAIQSANLFLKMKDLPSAQTAYQLAEASDPNNIEVRIFNVKLLEVRRRKREAKQAFDTILSELTSNKTGQKTNQ
jgi:tetratricopeptide (TPR) repeat protein